MITVAGHFRLKPEGGEWPLDLLIVLIISIMAGVLANAISKWLDGD